MYANFRKGGWSWDNKAPFGIDREDKDLFEYAMVMFGGGVWKKLGLIA